jgi:hypothetical protein
MSDAENPLRRQPGHRPTVEDIEALVAAATPHFALQVRDRVGQLIEGLPADDPARLAGEQLALSGELRGHRPPRPDLPPEKTLGPPVRSMPPRGEDLPPTAPSS